MTIEPIERRARVVWEGTLRTGFGLVSAESSGTIASAPVSWSSRVEEPSGRTSPEELMASAHAGCFAMALAATLDRMDRSADRLDVSVTYAMGLATPGFTIGSVKLVVRGQVPELDAGTFRGAAEAALQSCTVSRALAPSIELSVDATLDDPERQGTGPIAGLDARPAR